MHFYPRLIDLCEDLEIRNEAINAYINGGTKEEQSAAFFKVIQLDVQKKKQAFDESRKERTGKWVDFLTNSFPYLSCTTSSPSPLSTAPSLLTEEKPPLWEEQMKEAREIFDKNETIPTNEEELFLSFQEMRQVDEEKHKKQRPTTAADLF